MEAQQSHVKRGERSLSTCSKTQSRVLKTATGGIFLEWAKSRLQGAGDSQMKGADGGVGGAEETGVTQASPGVLPASDRISTEQDGPKTKVSAMFSRAGGGLLQTAVPK